MEEILNIGGKIGADVNPCIYRHTVLAEGIGDIVTNIESNSKFYLVIVKPKISCSTKEMFDELDKEKVLKNSDRTLEMKEVLMHNNIFEIANNLYNDFEIITDKNEEIIEIKKEIKKTNALKVMLSGSGSCVFGIYESKEKAKKAYYMLKEKYDVYYTMSF